MSLTRAVLIFSVLALASAGILVALHPAPDPLVFAIGFVTAYAGMDVLRALVGGEG